MKYLSSIILSLILLGIWGCTDLGNPVINDCPVDEQDCAGECGGSAEFDECDECNGDGSTCNISYSEIVQPIFSTNNLCTGCHGNSGGLALTSYDNLIAGGISGDVIIPGNGSESLIILKLRDSHAPAMPFGSCCIDSYLIDLIETWIDEGASNN